LSTGFAVAAVAVALLPAVVEAAVPVDAVAGVVEVVEIPAAVPEGRAFALAQYDLYHD